MHSPATHRALDEHSDPLCLSPETAAALLAEAPWRRFGVVGDSLSLGVGDALPGYGSQGWSDRVAALLAGEYLNLGRIGATTSQAVETQMPQILEFDPDLLYLPCGANDLVRREPDFESIERTTRSMYELAEESGALLFTFLLGRAYVVPAFPDWDRRIRRMNDITRSVAEDHGAIVVDMWDHPVNDRSALVSEDGIHFSALGQAVMATEVVRALAPFVPGQPR